MSTSATAAARARLLSALREVGTASSHCVLLCDAQTLRVLSHAVRMSELLEAAPHITLVDAIHTPVAARAPAALAASMDVIYFLSPKASSVEAALADHEGPLGPMDPPIYGGRVHMIFSRGLPDALLQRLRASATVGRIATLREVRVQYLPLAPAAFSLDAPGAFGALYGPVDDQARDAAITALAEQVDTVFSSLGLPAPRVRYAVQGHAVGRVFAERLDGLLKASNSKRARKGRRATLLLLERSYDPLTPLLHDFSYEALAEGLGLLCNGRYTRPGGKGDALLREGDSLWADLRRRPFEEVPERLRELNEIFLSEHEMILRAQRGEHMSLKQRQEASRAQFAFGFVRRHEALKVQQDLVEQLTTLLLGDDGSPTPLNEQLVHEQDLATGRGHDGREVRAQEALERTAALLEKMRARAPQPKATRAVETGSDADASAEGDGSGPTPVAKASSSSYLDDETDTKEKEAESLEDAITTKADAAGDGASADGGVIIDSEMERCRLLALLGVCHQVSDKGFSQAASAAGLAQDAHLPVSRSFSYLGMPLLPPHRAVSAAAASADDQVVEMSRHEPRLKALLSTALSGKLNPAMFPFVDADDAAEDAADPFIDAPSNPSPRSELVGSWAFHRKHRGKEGGAMAAGSAARGDHAPAAPRLFVLVLGGASYAEMRCALDAGGGGKVVFGCSALQTPHQYLRALQKAGGGYGDDAPDEPSVPVLDGLFHF